MFKPASLRVEVKVLFSCSFILHATRCYDIRARVSEAIHGVGVRILSVIVYDVGMLVLRVTASEKPSLVRIVSPV